MILFGIYEFNLSKYLKVGAYLDTKGMSKNYEVGS